MRRLSKYIKQIIMLGIIIFLGIFLNKESVSAASGKIEITTEESQVSLGEDFNVYINISSETMFRNFEAYLIYDEEKLEYKGGSSVISGGGGFLNISDINTSEEGYSRKYALQFEAKNVGSSNISFQNRIMLYDFENDMEMAVSSNSLTIEVKPAETASDNTYLKSLKTNPGELQPEFDKETYSYETEVDYYVDMLIVEALAEDSQARVKISGNDSLEEGENEVIITVTAESGKTAEYSINVNKEASPIEGEEDDEDVDSNGEYGEVQVEEVDGDLFILYKGRYKIVEPEDSVETPSNFVQTKISISGHTFDAYYPSGQLDSEFLLVYAMNESGEKGFYTYDRSEKTLQRLIRDDWFVGADVEEDEDYISYREYRSNINKAIIIIIVLAVISIALILLSISLYMKTKGHRG